ncbi:uncharacterized protein LOC122377627 [Amphibalanus amphitrite]|uniref:uncharacterized protein LOC122377627 n=1 Tax=Amphibalanus amphitrite TaxID=1232801 RepID=UPI001C9247A3|nr:uncharacterized protein LOC122377627 [Amphibalanus amphitrite]
MAPLRALLTAALVAAAAAAPSEGGAQGRYFPGLPTPLAPFIDFYETHIEPEDFVVLRGVSGTLAFVTFAFLMLAANMGLLPLNPAQLREDDFGKFKPFAPEHVNNAISYDEARSISNLIDEEPLTTRLPSCVPLLLCSLEVHGWTLPLQSSDSLLQRWRRPEPEETDPQRPAAASGDPCRRFRAVCAVPLLSDQL